MKRSEIINIKQGRPGDMRDKGYEPTGYEVRSGIRRGKIRDR